MAKPKDNPILSRVQRVKPTSEHDTNRLVLLGTGILVAVVLLLVGWTWVLDAVIYPNKVVASIEDVEIKGEEYIARTRLHRQQLINNYYQTYSEYQQLRQFFGDDPTLQQQYFTALIQMEVQMETEYAGEYTINLLVNEQLIKREAEALGISVSAEDMTKLEQELFGYFPDGTPTAAAPTVYPTSTLSALQLDLLGIASPQEDAEAPLEGDEPVELPTSTAAPTLAPTATQTAGPSPTPLPTATAYTQALYEENLQNYYSSYDQEVGVPTSYLQDALHSLLLREALKDHVTAALSPLQDQVWARHILVSTLEEADSILNRLTSGEDFAALATEVSLDTGSATQGGDLGWFGEGVMVEPFSNAAFALEIGEISEPIESQFGWHIIQVLGHEERGLSSAEFEQVREQAFGDYIETLRAKYNWSIDDSWRQIAPADPRIPQSLIR